MEARLPVTVSMSLVIHGGALGGWLYLNQIAKHNNMRVISNVELMVQVKRPQAAAPVVRMRRAPTPPSTWNFLKMALPSMPHVQQPMQVHVPQEALKKNIMDVKRLDDRGRLKKAGPMEALDMNRQHAALAQLDAAKLESRSHAAALAELPKLEEVGSRRASKAVIDMAESLEAERKGRLQGMDVPSTIDSKPVHGMAAQPLLPEEAQPSERPSALRKFAEMVTTDSASLPQPRQMMVVPKRVEMTEAPVQHKHEEPLGAKKKKSVEIEGPLSHRKVAYYELPQFPSWAAAQGIMEADVQIRFYVSPAGDVLPNMRVEATSGYGALDRLAMEALKHWRFQALSDDSGNQWGIITFRFVLE